MGTSEPALTIRLATASEKEQGFPPLVAGRRRQRVPKYVVVGENDRICTVFFMPLGGATRAEAIFWAERTASKNGMDFIRPAGWERVEGALPSER